MALDKQKILKELGNVVNQLQSADCGCMGKLFSNSNHPNENGGFQNAPMVSPAHDGCMRSCCHGHGCGHGNHGLNAPGAGEPFSGNRNCNPPKLYADTYNYLNNNLMQPVVKEVYDDLKSISPANTMMNNPMGAQMGLSPGNPTAPGTMGAQMGFSPGNPTAPGNMGGQMGSIGQNQMSGGVIGSQNAMPNQHHGPNVRFANSNMGNNMQMSNPNSQQPIGQIAQPASMAGMGPNIVNMMMGDTAAQRASNPTQGGTPGMVSNNVPQSPEMGQYTGGMPGKGQYNNMGQGNPAVSMQNPNAQYMSQPNMYAGANMQGNAMNGNMSQVNPGSQQMQTRSPAQPPMNAGYGQHNAGMAKFNEMFPGVMQGGDLGFDPMAIAIQMNPANQQKAAMDTMQKMLMSNGKGLNANAPLLQPVINATNTAVANVAQAPTNRTLGQQNIVPASMQQQITGANAAAVPVQNSQVPPQQAYTALTGAPTMNQREVPQQQIPIHQQQYQGQYQQQQIVDPNTGAVVGGTLPTVYEGSESTNVRQDGSTRSSSPPATQQIIKEPILPADTSRNMQPPNFNKFKYQHYNTLGQPIDMLPADMYRASEPRLPHTLSPQTVPRSDPGRYSNVKATVSKTSLMQNRPIGRTPSRGQLQQIYNQYKGSHSYTQQNIRPPDNGVSYSDGHLNVTQGNVVPQAQMEKVGGDTAANNAMNNPSYAEHKPDQVGDVPLANKPFADTPPADAEKAPVNNSRVRNGLQDMKYTAYATSAAWSFHGATPAPCTQTYRFRYKV